MSLVKEPIQIPVFEGPLDLLLQLIEREELEIVAVSLVQVTDQYLTIIEEMGRRGMSDLAAFLVVAAKLMLIKSRALLPRPPSEEEPEEDDVATDLINRLEEYRRFKRVAEELARRDDEELQAYVRVSPSEPHRPANYDLEGVTLENLFQAAHLALEAVSEPPVEEVISATTVTVAEQSDRIERRLRRKRTLCFQDVLSEAATAVEVIVTLLAVLELLKQERIRVRQEVLFGPILIERRESAPSAPEPSPG
jgi:segregation and condensation protein A